MLVTPAMETKGVEIIKRNYMRLFLVLFLLIALLFTFYLVKSIPINFFLQNLQRSDVAGINITMETKTYAPEAPRAILAELSSDNQHTIQSCLETLKQFTYKYHNEGNSHALGESLLLWLDMTNGKSVLIEMRKITRQDGSFDVIFWYESKEYVVQLFSQEKELQLFEALKGLTANKSSKSDKLIELQTVAQPLTGGHHA